MDAEVGYGLPVGSRFAGTPRVAVRPSAYGNEYRVGYDLGLLERAKASFNLNVDLHQREMPMFGETNRDGEVDIDASAVRPRRVAAPAAGRRRHPPASCSASRRCC